MGIIYRTEENGKQRQDSLGRTSLIDALREVKNGLRRQPGSKASLILEDKGIVIANDEILYLITYYGGVPNYNSEFDPNDSSILQKIRNLRENKKRNIGILYRTECNRVQNQFHFVGVCLIDVLRDVAHDVSMGAYDTVSLTLEDSGLMIADDELRQKITSYGGFQSNLEVEEEGLIREFKEIQEKKRKQQQRDAGRQQNRAQAKIFMDNHVNWYHAKDTTEHLAYMDLLEGNKTLWGILYSAEEGWEIFIEGKLQCHARSRDDAKETMISYITGEETRRR